VKSIVRLIPLLIVLILVAIGLIIFLKPQQESQTLSITPSQLMPSVSAVQARETICDLKKENFFAQICQEEFDVVGKEDLEKITKLSVLLDEIRNDKNLSDYDRLLLGQLIFASLPTKESPLTYDAVSFFLPFEFQSFVAHAQESNNNSAMSEEEFRQLMADDLESVIGNLSEGDNAWVISVMVAKHQWIDGERQPIYSDIYSESYDPYPGISTEPKDESKIRYHVRSSVGSRSVSQNQPQADGSFNGNSEMISYYFSINSWHSPVYGSDSVLVLAEAGPDAQYLTSRQDLSEAEYSGEDLLSDLLAKVPMPSRDQPRDQAEENESKRSGEFPRYYTHEEWQAIIEEAGTGPLPCPIVHSSDIVICHKNKEELDKEVCKYSIERWGPESPDGNYYPECH
jgi:hypothetical protein